MDVVITGYDEKTSRKDPLGLHVTFDAQSDRPIVALTFWLEDQATPLEARFPVARGTDGRYFRGLNLKPTITGLFHFGLRVEDDQGNAAEVRSETPVEVTEDPVDEENGNGDVSLYDQQDLVEHLRKTLFPALYEPGHPEANGDGWLRIDRIGPGQGNPEVGLERGALWAKHIAWSLADGGAGLATAKPGSGNHGGATAAYPGGFVTDIVCRSDGAHWDFQQDSAGGGYPQWNLLPETVADDHGNTVNLWAPIKARFVPAFDPATRLVVVNAVTGEVAPMDRAQRLSLLVAAA